MFRTSDMVLIAVMVAAAAFTYKTKQGAEEQLAAVRKIEHQIRFEEDSIDLLKADWSLLTQPSRLQRLSEAYQADLQLQPVDARQFVTLAEIPVRDLDIKDIIGEAMGMVAAKEPTKDQNTAKGSAVLDAIGALAAEDALPKPNKKKREAANAVPEEAEGPDETTTGAVDE